MRAAAALLCVVILGSACTTQETDQEKNRRLLAGAVDKAASSAVDFSVYRHLTQTAADGTVTETKLAYAGVYRSRSFTGELAFIDTKTDKIQKAYEYLVRDGQPYMRDPGTTAWRRPAPNENFFPSGDPGMAGLGNTVRRAVSISPYGLIHSTSKALSGYYHQFKLGLAPADVESLLGVKLADSDEPAFLRSASSRFEVYTASVDERLSAVLAVVSGTAPATKTKVSLELETIFRGSSNQPKVSSPPDAADSQKDRDLIARSLQAADATGIGFRFKGAYTQGSGATDATQIQATGVLKSGRVAMRYSISGSDIGGDYDIVLADRDIYVRPVGASQWLVAAADGSTWLMPVVRLALLKQVVLLSVATSSPLKVPQASFDPPPPPFLQPAFSGLLRDSGPGGSDNQYVVTPAPDQMAQLLLGDQTGPAVDKFASTIYGEVNFFLYPFGDRLSAVQARLALTEWKDQAYRSIAFSAVFDPVSVDAIAVPTNAVRISPNKIFKS
jgi:hypothetical protein